MKAMPTEDPIFGKGRVRPDGRVIHDMHLFEVKSPEQSKEPWDYYTHKRTIPADQAFRPLDQGGLHFGAQLRNQAGISESYARTVIHCRHPRELPAPRKRGRGPRLTSGPAFAGMTTVGEMVNLRTFPAQAPKKLNSL